MQQAGLLAPGKNRLSVHYKGTTYTAGLSRPGTILYEGMAGQCCLTPRGPKILHRKTDMACSPAARLNHARSGAQRYSDRCALKHSIWCSFRTLLIRRSDIRQRHSLFDPLQAATDAQQACRRWLEERHVRWCAAALGVALPRLAWLAPRPSANITQVFTCVLGFLLQAGHWSTTVGCTGRGQTQQAALRRRCGVLRPCLR